MSDALGLIEVNGYVAAIGAADAALKSANVHLLGLQKIKAGITTVKITGDVGAVMAAVEAGTASANVLGKLRASHVIPRLHEDVYKILPDFEKRVAEEEKVEILESEVVVTEKISPKKETEIVKEAAIKKAKNEEILEKIEEIDEEIDEEKHEAVVDFNSMKVEELRRLARSLNLPNMTNKQIKFAKKDILLKVISEFYKEGDK